MDNPDRLPGPLRLLLALTAALAVLLPGAPAWAHNALAEATPARNATVKKAPTSIKLRFLQKLKPDYTTITVAGASPVQASEAEVNGATGAITFEPLTNGVYTVAYRVVSQDGHTVQGSYKFTVADPSAASAPAPATTSPTPAPSTVAAQTPVADEESSSFPTVPVVIGAVVLALAAAGAVFFARRRRSG